MEIHLCRDVGSLRYAGSGLAFFFAEIVLVEAGLSWFRLLHADMR